MTKETAIKLFEEKQVRSIWDAEQEKWYISIIDVIAILTESVDVNAYWRKMKQRLKEEGNETVTNCHGLKMIAADGKMRMTDVADTEQLFRLIQSIPWPKAEPFKP
jgi:BRO family, N-terminal domain